MLFLSLFFFIFSSHSAVEGLRINGGSKTFNPITDQTFWGVMAGPDTNSGTTSPFNSCEIEPQKDNEGKYILSACHPRRVNGDTSIFVEFRETSEFNTAREAVAQRTLNITTTADPNTQNVSEIASSDITYNTNTTASLIIRWGEICREMGGLISSKGFCTVDGAPAANDGSNLISGNIQVDIGLRGDSFGELISRKSINFRLYNAANSISTMTFTGTPCEDAPAEVSGFCDIELFPGDGGGFVVTGKDSRTRILENSISYSSVSSSSSNDELSYTSLRLYFAESPELLLPFNGSVPRVDLDIESFSPLKLKEERFSNLTNGTTYYFRAASIDESGTISQFFGEDYCSEANCPYQITPSEVAGVIQESSCFITTATYGSDLAYQVQTFQKFRETFLRGHFLGKHVMSFYESYGPYGAVFINNHPWIKPFVRIALTPLYYLSKLSLRYGLFSVLVTFLSLSSTSVFLIFKRSR